MQKEDNDIRWVQRFSNLKKALVKLLEVVEMSKSKKLSDLEKEGLIQRFEYTYELAWKTLQDLLREKGYLDINGPNAVLTQSLADGYLEDADGWRKMKKSRELTSHTYDEVIVNEIAQEIIKLYSHLLNSLAIRLNEEKKKTQPGLFDAQ